MGTRALRDMAEKLGFLPEERQTRRKIGLQIDVPFLLVIITLMIFGLLMVYSASWDFSYRVFGDPVYTLRRQVNWMLLGVAVFVAMTLLDYHWWSKLALPAMAVTMIMLVSVLVLGNTRFGASRTLFGGSYQPSELAKLMIVIYLSVWLYNKRDRLREISFGLFPLALILGIVGGLILLQPDLSAVITVMILGGLMFFMAGGDLKQILLLLGFGALVGYVIVTSDLFPTGKDRILLFWAGLQDLGASSDHVLRSIEAFAQGGWFGMGIGKGLTKLTGLPFPHTDSIFAVVGEETGLFGAAILVLLFVGLMWRGLAISQNAKDGLGRLLAGGLTFWIVIEAFINMAVMIGLLPFAGNALPLISSGGSSLVMTLAGLGIVMNVARQGEIHKEVQERTLNEVVNLRGRDRRRRVSSAGGSPSAGIRRR